MVDDRRGRHFVGRRVVALDEVRFLRTSTWIVRALRSHRPA
jgi:hypothetical protein